MKDIEIKKIILKQAMDKFNKDIPSDLLEEGLKENRTINYNGVNLSFYNCTNMYVIVTLNNLQFRLEIFENANKQPKYYLTIKSGVNTLGMYFNDYNNIYNSIEYFKYYVGKDKPKFIVSAATNLINYSLNNTDFYVESYDKNPNNLSTSVGVTVKSDSEDDRCDYITYSALLNRKNNMYKLSKEKYDLIYEGTFLRLSKMKKIGKKVNIDELDIYNIYDIIIRKFGVEFNKNRDEVNNFRDIICMCLSYSFQNQYNLINSRNEMNKNVEATKLKKKN